MWAPASAAMLTEIAIFRSANVLIHEHGEGAGPGTAMRAEEMLGAEAEPKFGLAICVSALCP